MINVRLEIPHDDLWTLANKLDGKVTKREATRKEVNTLCRNFIGGMVEQNKLDSAAQDDMWPGFSKAEAKHKTGANVVGGIPIDDEDKEVLAGRDPGFIRGWYKVKRGTPNGMPRERVQ